MHLLINKRKIYFYIFSLFILTTITNKNLINFFREWFLINQIEIKVPSSEIKKKIQASTNYLNNKTPEGEKINSANDLALFLLEDGKISLVPGEDFGAPNCIRLSYAASENDLIEASSRLKESLSKLN